MRAQEPVSVPCLVCLVSMQRVLVFPLGSFRLGVLAASSTLTVRPVRGLRMSCALMPIGLVVGGIALLRARVPFPPLFVSFAVT